jgi:uridine phosphorylase
MNMPSDKFVKEYDVNRDGAGRCYHLKAKRGELNGYVLTCGSRERILTAKEILDESRVVGDNRGLTVVNGIYKNTPITLFCSGMGPSSTEISYTELIFNINLSKFPRATIIRAGTAGSWNAKVKPNDFVIETGVVRNEGSSTKVAPIEWPAVPDFLTNLIIYETAIKLKLDKRVHFGIGICKDTLYADEDPDKRSALGDEIKVKQKAYESLGALSTSMESAPFSVLTDFYNKKLLELGLDVKISYSCILLVVSPYYAQTSGVEFKVSKESEVELVKLGLESLARRCSLDKMYLEGKRTNTIDIDSILKFLYKSLN